MVTVGNDSDLPLPCHIDSTSLVKLNFGEVGTGTGDSRPWHDVVEVYGGPGAELCCRDGKLLRALLQIRNVLLASYWIVVSDEIWTAVWGICGVSVGVVVLMIRLNASCTVDPVPSAMPKC